MGQKIRQLTLSLMGVSALMTILAMFLPMHTFSGFSGLPGIHFLRMFTFTTYTLRFIADFKEKNDFGFCKVIRTRTDWECSEVAGSHDLFEMSERFCASGIRNAFPMLCTGTRNGYICGMSCILICCTQVFLQGISIWLAVEYAASPKRNIRQIAFLLMCIAASISLLNLIMYVIFVIVPLSNNPTGIVLSTSRGVPCSGFILLLIAFIIQMVTIVLAHFGKVKEERMLRELKMEQEFQMEMSGWQSSQAGAGAYPTTSGGGIYGVVSPPSGPYAGVSPAPGPYGGTYGMSSAANPYGSANPYGTGAYGVSPASNRYAGGIYGVSPASVPCGSGGYAPSSVAGPYGGPAANYPAQWR